MTFYIILYFSLLYKLDWIKIDSHPKEWALILSPKWSQGWVLTFSRKGAGIDTLPPKGWVLTLSLSLSLSLSLKGCVDIDTILPKGWVYWYYPRYSLSKEADIGTILPKGWYIDSTPNSVCGLMHAHLTSWKDMRMPIPTSLGEWISLQTYTLLGSTAYP